MARAQHDAGAQGPAGGGVAKQRQLGDDAGEGTGDVGGRDARHCQALRRGALDAHGGGGAGDQDFGAMVAPAGLR